MITHLSLTPVPTSAREARAICGFWHRISAYLIDSVILFVTTLLVTQLLYWIGPEKFFFRIGSAPILFGLSLIYFGFLNSHLGKGQTIGKRVRNIRVVTKDGQVLSVPRSVLRYLVLCLLVQEFSLAWQVDYMSTVQATFVSPLIGTLLDASVALLAGTIFFLYIINEATRQSLHDLIVGSYVVNAGFQGKPEFKPVRVRLSWIGLVALLTLLVNPSFLDWVEGSQNMQKIQNAFRLQQSIDEVWEGARLREVRTEEAPLYLSVSLPRKLISTTMSYEEIRKQSEGVAPELAQIFLQAYPDLEPSQDLKLSLEYRQPLFFRAANWSYDETRLISTW